MLVTYDCRVNVALHLYYLLQALTNQKQQCGSALPGYQHSSSSSSSSCSRPHFLVCAPSNAAVDEIARRLLREGLVMRTPKWREVFKIDSKSLVTTCVTVYMYYCFLHSWLQVYAQTRACTPCGCTLYLHV